MTVLTLAAVLVLALAAVLVATLRRPGFTRWTTVIIGVGILTVVVVAALFVVLAIVAIMDSEGTTQDLHRSRAALVMVRPI